MVDGPDKSVQQPDLPGKVPVEQRPVEPDPGEIGGTPIAIDRRPVVDDFDVILSAQRSGLTNAFLSRSSLTWVRPHVRTENVNLHTTFPRRFRSFRWWIFIVLTVGYLVVVGGLLLANVPVRLFVVQAIVVGAPIFLLTGARLLPIDGPGTWFQRFRQKVGATGWILDVFYTITKPKSMPLVVGLILAGELVIIGAIAWLAHELTADWIADLIDGWPQKLVKPIARNAVAVVVAAIILAVFLFWTLGGLERRSRGRGRDRVPTLPEQVHRLSMVQALSWTVLEPYRNRKGETSPQRPLAFVSSFNEGFDGYVGGFVEGMGQSLSGPWGLSPGFPQVDDGFRPFLEYVDRTSVPLEHSFCAYPHTSVVDVRNALHVDRSYRSFRAEKRAGATDADVRRFLDRVRHALPSIPGRPILQAGQTLEVSAVGPPTPAQPPDPLTVDRRISGNDGLRTTILLSVLEFAMDEAGAVREAIQDLPGGFPDHTGIYAHAESPFNAVEGTHLGRLTVVSPWTDNSTGEERTPIYFHEYPKGENDESLQPENAWILLSAQIDDAGSDGVTAWLLRLYDALESVAAGTVQGIWGPAASLRDDGAPTVITRDTFGALILSGREQPEVHMIDHEDVTVWDVIRSLSTHRIITEYLHGTAAPTAAGLDGLAIPKRVEP